MELTVEQKKVIDEYDRCRKDFAYFVDNYCLIQDRKTKRAIPFKLWDGQKSVVPLILDSIYLFVLKARQLGLTWLVAAYSLWRGIFNFHELIIVISAKEDLAIEFLDRVKFMFDRLPDWMKPSVYKRTTTELTYAIENKDSAGNIVLEGLNSTIKSIPSTPDAGQSKTISLLVLDESALNRYCSEIWSAAKPTLEHADGQAIILSNPSKDKPGWGWSRDIYTGSMRDENEFKRVFLNWQCVPGRGDDFIEKQRRAGLDDDDIIMQYPTTEEEAISILGGSYFGKSLGKYKPYNGERGFLLTKNDKPYFEPDKKGILEIWDHPEKEWEHRYAIGSDVSEGLGDTSSVAYVYDRVNNHFVARMRSNRVDADEWAKMLINLGRYYNNAFIGPERNGAGITTIIHLQNAKYVNLFYRMRPGNMKGTYITEYGWNETNENKQILADELRRHYRDVFTRVPCGVLLDESSTFMRHDNGRLAHEDGKYDDCVIAAGIALQVSIMMPAPFGKKSVKPRSFIERHIEMLEKGSPQDEYERIIHTGSREFLESMTYEFEEYTGTVPTEYPQ